MTEIKSDDKNPGQDFDAVFHAGDYLYFYEDSIRDEYTDEQIAFLVRELSLGKQMKILDLACGHGRHANRLARSGTLSPVLTAARISSTLPSRMQNGRRPRSRIL